MKKAIENKMRAEYQDIYNNRREYQDENQSAEEWKNEVLDTATDEIYSIFDDYINASLRFCMITEQEAAELKDLNNQLWNQLEEELLEEIDYEEMIIEELDETA